MESTFKKENLIVIFILSLFGIGNASASLIFDNNGINTTIEITENIEFIATGDGDVITRFVFQDVYSTAPGITSFTTVSNTIDVLINGISFAPLSTSSLWGPFAGNLGEIDPNDFTISFDSSFVVLAGDVVTLTSGIAVTAVDAALMPDLPATTAIMLTNTGAAISVVTNVSAVPVPAAVWLFGSGLLGLIGVARRKKS